MVEKLNEQLNKKDLELILEVNKKAIEIETEVAEQNEDIIEFLNELSKNQKAHGEKIDKIVKGNEDLSKDIFKIQVLFISGLLSLVIQVIQLWTKK